MRRGTFAAVALTLGAGLAGCGREPVTAPASGEPAAEEAFSVYGAGTRGPVLHFAGCRSARHRQFDFWLGSWNVFGAAGTQVGTNEVESRGGGCIVQENWTSAGGIRGRSLNMFDRDDGQWHQTWVSEGLGHLRMAGGIQDDGHMLLKGERVSARSGVQILDEYEWTPISADSVLQQGKLEVPALGILSTFTGTYVRSPEITPAPSTELPGCQEGGASARSREMDFWLGSWKVRTQHGIPIGEAVVEADLSGCLLQQHFTSYLGLEALAFVYYDPTVQRWYATYGDSSGERTELEGDKVGDAIVMSGTDRGLLGRRLRDVRATWASDGPDRVLQSWEVSAGNDRWVTVVTLVYTRS